MRNIFSLILLAAGVSLIVFGVMAMDSFASDFTKFFTGAPTDTSIWMLIGGILLLSVSGFGLFAGSRDPV